MQWPSPSSHLTNINFETRAALLADAYNELGESYPKETQQIKAERRCINYYRKNIHSRTQKILQTLQSRDLDEALSAIDNIFRRKLEDEESLASSKDELKKLHKKVAIDKKNPILWVLSDEISPAFVDKNLENHDLYDEIRDINFHKRLAERFNIARFAREAKALKSILSKEPETPRNNLRTLSNLSQLLHQINIDNTRSIGPLLEKYRNQSLGLQFKAILDFFEHPKTLVPLFFKYLGPNSIYNKLDHGVKVSSRRGCRDATVLDFFVEALKDSPPDKLFHKSLMKVSIVHGNSKKFIYDLGLWNELRTTITLEKMKLKDEHARYRVKDYIETDQYSFLDTRKIDGLVKLYDKAENRTFWLPLQIKSSHTGKQKQRFEDPNCNVPTLVVRKKTTKGIKVALLQLFKQHHKSNELSEEEMEILTSDSNIPSIMEKKEAICHRVTHKSYEFA